MDSFIDFKPPQLPHFMTGAQLSNYVGGLYPELLPNDALVGDLTAAMDAYNFAKGEYQARNSHFGEWMDWYKKNPTQKDRVVAFATEHNVCFSSAGSALQMIEKAIGRLIEAWGDRNDLSSIRTIVANVETDKKNLADNLQAILSAFGPGGQPQIRPQKRAVADPRSETPTANPPS